MRFREQLAATSNIVHKYTAKQIYCCYKIVKRITKRVIKYMAQMK